MKIAELVSRVTEANKGHGGLPIPVRRQRLTELRREIAKQESAIAEALRVDLGKSHFEAFASEIGFIQSELKHTLKSLDRWAKPRRVSTPVSLKPGKSLVYPQPFGVVLIIAPWNYPFQLCLSPLIGAVAAGNRVVLKPSEFTDETTRIIRSILESVFQSDEVAVIEGAVEETKFLLEQSFDYIFFTGSTPVGKVVMQAAASKLTPVTLELGGKSPCLILESADLDLAARRCAWGKFMNAGQTCVAPDYVLVPRSLQGSFIDKLRDQLTEFYGKDPKTSPDYSRIINQRHFDRLAVLLKDQDVALGGALDRSSKYIAPTVLRDVSWDSPVMRDEIFGPILPVIPYESVDEALAAILRLDKPLALYLFSQNAELEAKIIERIPFGGGCINDTIIHLANPDLPFGGVGPSGMGSYHGKKSFETFSHLKSIFRQSTLVDVPVRYPPYAGKMKWLKFFLG